MDPNRKDRILSEQLGKVGRVSGAVGGFVGGGILGGLGGAMGGESGAQWAAGKLKTVECTEQVTCVWPIADAMSRCFDTLSNLPNLLQMIDAVLDSEVPYIAAVVGSGFGNMNPTIVCVEFVSNLDGGTTMYVSASAKEGLIKQKASQKAVQQLTALLGSH